MKYYSTHSSPSVPSPSLSLTSFIFCSLSCSCTIFFLRLSRSHSLGQDASSSLRCWMIVPRSALLNWRGHTHTQRYYNQVWCTSGEMKSLGALTSGGKWSSCNCKLEEFVSGKRAWSRVVSREYDRARLLLCDVVSGAKL